jgi:hypothetical protein
VEQRWQSLLVVLTLKGSGGCWSAIRQVCTNYHHCQSFSLGPYKGRVLLESPMIAINSGWVFLVFSQFKVEIMKRQIPSLLAFLLDLMGGRTRIQCLSL